jgi:hypothetical protein
MSALRRPLLRTGTAVVGTAALVAVASPANAAADLTCESGALHIACSVNGAAAGSTIHWTLNGNPISSWDNTAFIRFGCTRNVLYQIGVQVAAPSGETSTSTRGVRCTNNPPV